MTPLWIRAILPSGVADAPSALQGRVRNHVLDVRDATYFFGNLEFPIFEHGDTC